MPRLGYRHPDLNPGHPKLVDPVEINESFEDIARLVNGNLGAENLLGGGRTITNAMLAHPRGWCCAHYNIDTSLGTWPAAGKLFAAKYAISIQQVDVYGASGLDADLVYGTDVICALNATATPAMPYYSITSMSSYAAVAPEDEVGLTVNSGSLDGLVIWFTVAHQAP